MTTILVCGLPGSGKTTLSEELLYVLGNAADWYNADKIREQFNDWDFSDTGRKRQMERMKSLCQNSIQRDRIAIADFVCPTKELRDEFNADFVIWMDTIDEGRFEDTNKIFESLDVTDYNAIITEHEWWTELYTKQWAQEIVRRLRGEESTRNSA